jgi:hypothetical protein
MKKILLFIVLTFHLFSEDRFQISGDVIKDFRTELMWQRESSYNTMNWSRAKNYCQNLSLAGYRDWRLPHIDELKSIVNYERYNPATFNGFKLKTTDWHWTITKYNSSRSRILGFYNGNGSWNSRASSSFAVCVRDL